MTAQARQASSAELIYDTWGMPESPNKLLNNDHGNYVFATFTGHIYDTTLDIYFAEARFYDANNRTWLAVDPIKDGLNWYQYCYSNPTTYWDPAGLKSGAVTGGGLPAVETVMERAKEKVRQSQFNKMSCRKEKTQKEAIGDMGMSMSIISEYNLRILKLVVNSSMGLSTWSNGIERYLSLFSARKGDYGALEEEFYEFIRMSLTEEQKIFLSTVSGEAIGEGEIGWAIVSNVILNRTLDRYTKGVVTVRDVIEKTGFDAYTNKKPQYFQMMNYLETGEDDYNGNYKKLFKFAYLIFEGPNGRDDITNGAMYYYSPKNMGNTPSPNWAKSDKEVIIPGVDPQDFRVFLK